MIGRPKSRVSHHGSSPTSRQAEMMHVRYIAVVRGLGLSGATEPATSRNARNARDSGGVVENDRDSLMFLLSDSRRVIIERTSL